MSLTTLVELATKWALRRGHNLQWTPPYHGESQSLQNAQCTNCPAEVQVNTKPMPNEIDIGGSAVALDCPIKE